MNKFVKNYPDYTVCRLGGADIAEITAFLKLYEGRQLAKGSVMAREEMEGVYELLPHLDDLKLLAAAIKVEGKIIALSIGERCGSQLVIHVEKALTDYEGAYPAMAREFA